MPKGGNGGGGNGGGGGGGLPKITGRNNSDDLLIGTGVAELIKGLSGNDTLIGNGGDDILDGGADHDIASYSGTVFDYDIDIAAGLITDLNAVDGDDGQDTLINIEQAVFADATVFLDGANNSPLVSAAVTSGSVSELTESDPDEGTRLLSASGSIDFVEFDRTTGHTLSVVDGGIGLIGSLTATFTDSDTSDGAGQVSWAFEVTDAELDHLAAGESVVQTYDVVIDDGQGGSATKTVSITLTGADDGPDDIQLSNNQVSESVINALVGTLTAPDPDSNDPVTFEIVPGQDGHLFEIIGDQLWLGSTPLDYEYMNTRSLTVRATDSEGATYDETLTIDVVNQTIEYLTIAADSNAATFEDTVFVGDATTLDPGDSLVGSEWSNNWLYLLGYGSYDLSALAAFSGIEHITVDTFDEDEVSPVGGQIDLVFPKISGVIQVDFLTIGDTETWVDGVFHSSFYQVNGGSGNDVVHVELDAFLGYFYGFEGDDEVYVNSYDPIVFFQGDQGNDRLQYANIFAWLDDPNDGVTIDGGTGYDTLSFAASGNYTFEWASMVNVEQLLIEAVDVTLYLYSDNLTDVASITSTQTNSVLISAEPILDLRGVAASGLVIESNAAFATEFLVDDKAVAFQIIGGDNSYGTNTTDDKIHAFGLTFTAAERQMIFDTTEVELIEDDSGVYGDEKPNLIVARDSGGIVSGGGNGDFHYGGIGDDQFVFTPDDEYEEVYSFETGAGSNDVIDLQAFDPAAAQAAADSAMQSESDTIVFFEGGPFIVLVDTLVTSLHADDFLI